jgi:hypothetical protein
VGNSLGPLRDLLGKVKDNFFLGVGKGGRGSFEDGNQWAFGRSSTSGRLGRSHIRGNMGWLETVNGNRVSAGTDLEAKGMGIFLEDFERTLIKWSQRRMGGGGSDKNIRGL